MTNNRVTGRTRVCGLIGDRVEHSVSPMMHGAAFRKLGLDYVYVTFKVMPESLPEAVAGMRALNIRGLNVTIPHKIAVMGLLDEVDTHARGIGAVNTIVNDNGVLKGYNTDAPGFLRALREAGVEPAGKKILILGAGGAARGICYALAESGARLVILNRQVERATALARSLAPVARESVEALPLHETSLQNEIKDADILVNATSVGMTPDIDHSLVPAHLLHDKLVVFDIIGIPARTKLFQEAAAAGARTIAGLEMLVWQGALSFELWTGQSAPFELMHREAQKALQHEE
ncbi:MAG: shikimate dehydrogenase [Dehalococcoidales bacterium]|nr:shikimate dehydrogenase [Dehalococcoidales bacterium]